MNKKDLIQKIKKLAQQDKDRRQDQRYLKAMGFLVAKGFLYTNKKKDNHKIDFNDHYSRFKRILTDFLIGGFALKKQ